MNKTIFISHSSKDKPTVRRLVNDLQRRGISVWFDENEIKVGERFVDKIQKGITESKYIGIWITKNAIDSGWVEKEWQSRISEEITKRNIVILPLLAEDCYDLMPIFLADKQYADFRFRYEDGLYELLKVLEREKQVSEWQSILSYTIDLLNDLDDAAIAIPLHKPIFIIKNLKKLPRSGKRIRLENYEPKINIRSIYDHILSLAHSADMLFSIIDHGIHNQEIADLVRCIVYHDLCEVLLGDIPAYTNLSNHKRNQAQIFAERRLREIPKNQRENTVNDFIYMYLSEREKESFLQAKQILNNPNNHIFQFFNVLDKIDPIITIWRYLHFYRGKLDENATVFMQKLKDFFDNPEVKKVAVEYKRDHKIYDLVLILQDKNLARKYYNDENSLNNINSLFDTINPKEIKQLIEGKNIIYANIDLFEEKLAIDANKRKKPAYNKRS